MFLPVYRTTKPLHHAELEKKIDLRDKLSRKCLSCHDSIAKHDVPCDIMSDSPTEREFGVPFPGRVVDPARWTQTALKAMPESGPLDWPTLFGRLAPVVLDLGCGNGRFLIGRALLQPEWDHLGIDILPVVIRYARKRGNQRGLTNLRFAVLGGYELLANYVPPQSVQEIHVYHPQPYYDPALIHKRLITPDFLRLVHRALKPGGQFILQTDHPSYWDYMKQVVPCFFEFHERIGRWPDAPKGRTRREILALKKRLPVFRGHGIPKPDLDEAAMLNLAESLPVPTFNADRKLRDLDRLA
jgi:tRNA (guanine-N7-)-methyltransferase